MCFRSWTINVTMDLLFCHALVEFDVDEGKTEAPPIRLTGTVWTQSLVQPSGTLKKYVIEWTDSSGMLALPETPLNTWVQLDHVIVPKRCIEESPVVFKDMHDGDSKYVSISENQKYMKITPFGSDDRL